MEEERDIYALNLSFISKVVSGKPASLETFKDAWKQMCFSFIFLGCPPTRRYDSFVQGLYDVSLKLSSADVPLNLIGRIHREDGSIIHDASESAALAIREKYNELRHACALYSLFCLYHAQPNGIQVKIRVKDDYFGVMQRLGRKSRDLGPRDAAVVLGKMLKEQALVYGAGFHKSDVLLENSITHSYRPGAGALSLPPGIHGEEAAAVRETRFHLDSTLTALATSKLENSCDQYKKVLSSLLGKEKLGLSEGVADLSFGQEIHRMVTLASHKIQMILLQSVSGNRVRRKKYQEAMKNSQRTMIGKSKAAGFKAVLARDLARKKDIRNRKRYLERTLGISTTSVSEDSESCMQDVYFSSDEDMPSLEIMEGSLIDK
eukprot:jgi/Picsp_1/3310/NSC_06149-R1_unnamed protein product [Ostreococcus tauri]